MPRRCLLLLTGLALLLPAVAAADRPLTVYVSVPPQRFLVQRVGAERVRVEVLLPTGQVPETWDPSARQLQRLTGARLYFLGGVPFERSRLGALRRLAGGVRIIPCCEALLDEGERGLDPHVWASPDHAGRMAGIIHRALVREDPEGEPLYTTNRDRLLADLQRLDARIRERLAGRRIDVFITSHAAWGHLARDYGLEELSLERNGREIGARGLAELLQRARRLGIRTVFTQGQYRTPVVQTLAGQLGAQVVELDPLAEDYIDNLLRVAARLAEALQ